MEEVQIVAALWNRSETILDEVQRKYWRFCLNISLNIVGNSSDAEECVNDVLLTVWNTIPPQKPQSLTAYIGRLTRNISLHRFRYNTAQKRGGEGSLTLDELYNNIIDKNGTENEGGGNYTLLSDALNAFLGTLESKNRILFVRRYFFEDSIQSIAVLTGLSENNIHQHLHKIRIRLRKYLIKEGFIYEKTDP